MDKTFGRKLRQGIGILLVAAVIFNMLPLGGLAVSASENSGTGICEHHTEHTADCGYAEAGDCRHEHTEECYTAEGKPDCHHEHDEGCDYAKAHECTYVCEICSNEASGEDDVKDSDAEASEENSGSTSKDDTEKCICGTLCTEDSINGDCPVCGAEDADLSRCKGEKTENSSEENKEDAGQEDTGAQDDNTNLCTHHKGHTKDCGYSRASEDGEGSPCTYECRICPIEALIAALPRALTEDNAETVRWQLDEILDLWRELSEDEQEQIDLSPCWDLQAALDPANEPVTVDKPTEGAVAQVEIAGSITDYSTIEAAWTAANGNTATITLLADVTANGTLTVDNGSTITFDGGDHTLTSGQQIAIQVNGTFKLVSGTIKSTCSSMNATGINVNGTLEMTGGTVTASDSFRSTSRAVRADSNSNITISGGKISGVYGIGTAGGTVIIQNGEISGSTAAVDVNNGNVTIDGGTFTSSYSYGMNIESGTVVLRGGTFTGGGNAIWTPNSVASLLDKSKPYVYFDANGQPVNLSNLADPKKLPEGTYTVGECTHLGALKDLGNGTHGGTCPYCGYTEAAEPCTYGTEYKHDNTNHWKTCEVCQGTTTPEAHYLRVTADEPVNGVTQNREACDYCDFTKNPFTVTVTVPSGLTYGNTVGIKPSYTVGTEKTFDVVQLALEDGEGNVEYMTGDTLPDDLSAGNYKLHLKGVVSGNPLPVFVGRAYFTVAPAPLTRNMVTLSPESVTYKGAEQKPAITVKQGETTLTEGKDYNVTYSTTDFTNAGTVIVTITGKGNYKGTVEKTYTIKKAVLTATGTGIANGTYGAKLSELSVTGLKAVYQGTGAEVPGTWKLTGSTVPSVGDAGTYTASFTPAAGAKNFEPLTAQVKLNIAKAAAPVPYAGTLYAQNNRKQSYQYDLTQLLPVLDNGKSYGAVNYTLGVDAVNISGCYYTDGARITGTTLTLPIQKVADNNEGNIGTISITITSRNYEDMTAVIHVTSVNKIPVNITGVSVERREYNGEAASCTGTLGAVESGGDTATISSKDYRYTWKKADGTILNEAPKNAGSYLLIVSVDNDTYIGSKTISFVIDKAKITITADSMTADKGGAEPALAYTISGLAKGDALTTEPTLTCIADMNTAGRYPITASGAEVPNTDNYHSEITYVPGILTVTVKTPSGGSGSSGGGNSGGSGTASGGNSSSSENNGDSGQGSSSDNGGGNATPGASAIPSITDTNPKMDTEAVKPRTGNTVRQGSGTGTGSSAAQETGLDTGIPFIKGEDGKIGWNVIRTEEEKAEEGSVINVDMNGTTVVPGDIFDSIKGRDVTITFDLGGGILWSVDGKSIITDKADDIDFTVRMGGSAVPVEIVNNVTGEHYSIQLSLAYDGEFGFTAVLSVNLEKENAGYTASLYYYNQNAGELEFMCADEVAEDGTVSFAFTHASDYVIVIDKISEEPAPESAVDITEAPAEEEGNSVEAVVSPKEIGKSQKSSTPWIILAGVAVVILGAAGILIWKRKKEEGNREAK